MTQNLLLFEDEEPKKTVLVTHRPCDVCGGVENTRCDAFIYHNGFCKNPKLRAAILQAGAKR